MLKILQTYDIPSRLVTAIELIPTTLIEIKAGVLQGDALAPFLFFILLDYAMRKANHGRESDLGFTIMRARGVPVGYLLTRSDKG